MRNKKILLCVSFFLLINLIGCLGVGGDNNGGSTGTSNNNPPTVALTGNPNSGTAPLTVQFTANAQDTDGNVVNYEWDFDSNGVYDSTTTVNTASYIYTSTGTYNAKVKVTDNGGATAEAAAQIIVSTSVTGISFTPAGSSVNNSVYLSQVSTNNDEITLAVNAKGVTNLHGAAIEITFDGSKISYISALKGDFLGQGGTNTIFSANLEQGNNGLLLVGIDRTGTNVGVSGDGVLATIVLKGLTIQANTSISFNAINSGLKLPSGGGSIGGVNWLGGSLSCQ